MIDRTPDWGDRFWSQVHPEALSGCWLWHGAVRRGYGSFRPDPREPRRRRAAHRVAFERSYGPIPAGLDVLHKCDVPACVNPDHLRAGTHAENMADKCAKGRQARPESKLTSATVAEVHARRAAGESLRSIARAVGVSAQWVWKLTRGARGSLAKEGVV